MMLTVNQINNITRRRGEQLLSFFSIAANLKERFLWPTKVNHSQKTIQVIKDHLQFKNQNDNVTEYLLNQNKILWRVCSDDRDSYPVQGTEALTKWLSHVTSWMLCIMWHKSRHEIYCVLETLLPCHDFIEYYKYGNNKHFNA